MRRRSPAGARLRWARALALVTMAAAALVPCISPSSALVSSTIGGDLLAEAGVVVDLAAGAVLPPVNEAAAYVVADLETGEILAAKSAHGQHPPASTLKVLTALTLLPELDKDLVVVGTDEDVMVEGSKVGIAAGLSYSVDLLFRAMLVDSGNDAAQALARTAGGVDRTVAAMKGVALELGAFDTHVVNPSGLDEPGQVTSAYDLALIARAALERPDFRTYVTTPTADLPARDGTSYQIQNGNRLLGSYEGLIGVKTGYTTLARHTYVGAAERGGRGFVVTVLRTEDRAELVAASLLDWAFLNADAVVPVGELVVGPPVPVISAAPEDSAGPLPAPGRSAGPGAAAPDARTGGGLGATTTAAVIGVGLVGAVAGLRIRAVRRERLRRERLRRSLSVGHRT